VFPAPREGKKGGYPEPEKKKNKRNERGEKKERKRPATVTGNGGEGVVQKTFSAGARKEEETEGKGERKKARRQVHGRSAVLLPIGGGDKLAYDCYQGRKRKKKERRP